MMKLKDLALCILLGLILAALALAMIEHALGG